MQDIYDCTVQYIIENQNKFYRLAYSYVQEEQAALDVVQNAICRALEGCFGLKNPLALKTWFYRILVNESLQYLRKRKKETTLTEEHTAALTYSEPAFEEDKRAYEAVMQLPEAMKNVVLLHYYEDLTLKQIAEITDTPLSTVKTRLYSALKKLKLTLKEEAL
ncbi:sigma-70 family RNA polymerase sigma factor [Anaerotignum sp.]